MAEVSGLDIQNAVTLGRILGRVTVGYAEVVPEQPTERPDRPDVDQPVEEPGRPSREPLPEPDPDWFHTREARMRATLRIPEDQFVWDPGILVLPHGGVLELTLINDDKNTHCALLPSNGDSQFLWLVNHSKGTATLELDGPGYYWYSSTTGNDEGRGLTGAIVVGGEVPPEARLDRPPQPRP